MRALVLKFKTQPTPSSFLTLLLPVTLCLVTLFACTEKSSQHDSSSGKLNVVSKGEASSASLAALVSATMQNHQEAMIVIGELNTSIKQLLADPSEENLQLSQQAWLKAHLAFLMSQQMTFDDLYSNNLYSDNLHNEIKYPFFADDLENLILLNSVAFFIDATSMEEGFLDALKYYPDSGIMMDITIKIDRKTLRQQHGISSEEEICLGFHPLEYLLWERPISDFAISGHQDNNHPIMRRRKALGIMAELLEEDSKVYFGLTEKLLKSLPEKSEDLQSVFLLTLVKTNISNYSRLLRADPDADVHSRFSLAGQDAPGLYLKRIYQLVSSPVWTFILMKSIDDQQADSLLKLLEKLSAQSEIANPDPESKVLHLEMVDSMEKILEEMIGKARVYP